MIIPHPDQNPQTTIPSGTPVMFTVDGRQYQGLTMGEAFLNSFGVTTYEIDCDVYTIKRVHTLVKLFE